MKKVWLWVLFFLTLFTRLFFVFKTSTFSLDAYFTLRQIESISATFLPLYHDSLAFGGTTYLFMPLFYYVLSFFSLFFSPELVLKVLPNIFMSSLVFSSFFLSKKLTNNDSAALISSSVSAFIPVLFASTIFSASPLTLLLPLMVYQIYSFLDGKTVSFVILCFTLPLIHYFALIVPLSLFLFFLILKLEDLKLKKSQVELSMLSLIITFWMFLIFFKYALLKNGISFFTSFPLSILKEQLFQFSFINAIYLVGTIPFLYGMYAAYSILHHPSGKKGLLILSFCFVSILLLFTPLMNFNQSMIFVGVFLSILFSSHYTFLKSYLSKTKFTSLKYYWFYFVTCVFVSLIIASLIPSIILASNDSKSTVSSEELKAITWLSKEVGKGDVVLASMEESQLLNSRGIKTMMDTHLILAPNMPERYEDYSTILSTPYVSEATKNLNLYGVKYIYLSRASVLFPEKFNADCFKELFNNGVRVLEVKCQLKSI